MGRKMMRENEANLSQISDGVVFFFIDSRVSVLASEIFFVASLKVHFDKFATLLRFHFPSQLHRPPAYAALFFAVLHTQVRDSKE